MKLTKEQQQFINTDADFAIFGGEMACGKSTALLNIAYNHKDEHNFVTGLFIHNPYGCRYLFDEYVDMLNNKDNVRCSTLTIWDKEICNRTSFDKVERLEDAHRWGGAIVNLMLFDDLSHIDKDNVMFLMSRSRTVNGVKPKIRATIASFWSSWINDTFLPYYFDRNNKVIKERLGKFRWYYFDQVKCCFDIGSYASMSDRYGKELIKSFTYIHSYESAIYLRR